VQAKL